MRASSSEKIQAELGLRSAQDALRHARARVRKAKAKWHRARQVLGRWYRSAKARARRRAREYRARERERIRRQIVQWWAELKEVWAGRRRRIDELGLRGLERARAVEKHQRQRLRDVSGHKRRVAAEWTSHRAAEQRGESDEQVVRDLEVHHPELVPIFRAKRRTFEAKPGMSRVESVLHWAHDNPDELLAMRSSEEERELRAAIREHELAERAAAREARGSKPPKSRRHAWASVPF